MDPKFVHLRVHSEFSLTDGLVRVGPLMKSVAAADMPSVAVTDRNNFFGLIKAYKAAEREGVKLIIGADFEVLEDDERRYQATFLAQSAEGYRNLTLLISQAYQEGQILGRPLLRRDWIQARSQGLIALSGGRLGDVGQHLVAGRSQEAKAALEWWMSLFPDRYYVELQRTGRENEEDYLHSAVALAAEENCPVVATNEVCFLTPEEYDAHEARVCIGDGRTLNDPRRPRHFSDQQYLRSPDEMIALFADIPEAIENTIHIAARCSTEIELGKAYLPDFPTPEGVSIEQHLEDLSNEGLDKRLAALNIDDDEVYRARLKFELDIINQMGFPGYFLVVMDFIRWGKANGIPVGPGRGSGAGSLVAYALEITDLDPIEYDLLFERFLNPQRVSMPDFDVDFCMDRRDEVIDYVAETYGRNAVSQIITFGTMAAKAVVRDVARVQDKPYALADKMSKLIPFEVGMTLEKALEQEEQLVNLLEEDSAAQEIWDMAVQLEGLTRNAGKHAGGVVIAPSQLTDFSPLFCDEEGHGLGHSIRQERC
jgi:DNA polymerase-3 subunit alpha